MKTGTRILAGTAAVGALLFAGEIARACFIRSPLPVQVWADHVEVVIRDQVAVKKYDCKFLNPNPQAVVGGECYMEVEPGAQVDDMSLTIDGKKVEAELLSKEKANEVFVNILKEGGSPALLEFFGNQLIRSRVPRIPPNGTVTVKLQYTTVLKARNGVVRMQFLNTNPKAELKPLKKASVLIRITSKTPIKNVYSPTHPLRIRETDQADIQIEWSRENYLPKTPFVFYYALSEEPVGANLLSYKNPGEDGYFMLMVSPTVGRTADVKSRARVLPKDVVFCVDTSGSLIENGMIEPLKQALAHCIGRLNDGDRYNIVRFSTEPRPMAEGLIEVNEETKARGLAYVKGLRARGGTAMDEALQAALRQFDGAERMKVLLFMTDGRPTIGETNADKILRNVATANGKNVRIFAFGLGHDINTRLLDALASENRGDAEYILPEEKIEEKIGPYFDRIGSPVMTDVRVEVSGVEVEDLYPKRMPDLFKGGQITVFGRYRGEGPAEVHVLGRVNGEEVSFSYPVTFSGGPTKEDFVPRLWAGQKVNFLLGELRRNGGNKEVIEVVTALAKRFGIVTPYTSYLVVDDRRYPDPQPGPRPLPLPLRSLPAQQRLMEKLQEDRAAGFAGGPAAKAARRLDQAREGIGGGAYDELAEQERRARGEKGSAMRVMRYIGTKTFYQAGGVWYESRFDPEKHKDLKEIKIGSDAYFELLRKHEGIAKYLALGQVILEYGGVWYEIKKSPSR